MNEQTKLPYESAEMEIIAFESEDIITTSAEGCGFDGEWVAFENPENQ